MNTLERTFTKTHVLYTYETGTESDFQTVCNIKCIHCYYRFDKQKWRALESMEKEVDSVIQKGADHIQLNGAEPTLHPDFLKLIKYIHSKGILCSVITNGHLLASKEFAEKTKPFIEYYLFSVHGATEKTVNLITQNPKSWTLIQQALTNLEELDIEVQINYTVMRLNYQEIPEIKESLMKYKNIKRFNFINFNPFHSWEGKEEIRNLIVSYDGSVPILEKTSRILIDSGFDIALRYFPFCKVPEWLWPYTFNFVTSLYDRNEWRREWMLPEQFQKNKETLELVSEKLKLEGTKEENSEHAFARYYKGFRKFFYNHNSCENCSHKLICDLPHREQVHFFPEQKFETIHGDLIKSVKHHFTEKPFVSVIIPTYNRKEILELSIKSGLQQDYPKEKYEIIIVDDGSTDGTKELVEEYITKYGKEKIRYFWQDDLGYRVGQARNLGAKHARGEILVFWNQDIIAMHDLLHNFVKSLDNHDVIQGYTSGYTIQDSELKKGTYNIETIKKLLNNSETSKLNDLLHLNDARHEWFIDDKKSSSIFSNDIWKVFIGTCFAIKKSTFERHTFNEKFVGWRIEDHELGYRLLNNGFSIILDNNCICLHLPHDDELFNDKKINEWIKNMVLFYTIHRKIEVKNYIKHNLSYKIPEIFRTKKIAELNVRLEELDNTKTCDKNLFSFSRDLDIRKKSFEENLKKFKFPERIVKKSFFSNSKNRIIMFSINGIGLGHLSRTINIANSIKKINKDVDILFITKSKSTFLLKKHKYNFVQIENEFDDYSVTKNSKIIKEITTMFKPNIFIIDSPAIEYCLPEIISFGNEFCNIKKIYILRHQKEFLMRDLFLYGEKYFSKILIPHIEEEFFAYSPYAENTKELILSSKKIEFVGNIFKEIDKVKITKIKEKYNVNDGDYLIVINGGGGGLDNFSDSPKKIFQKINKMYEMLNEKIKNLKIIIITGPYFNEQISINPEIQTVKEEENNLELFSLSKFVISSAGYNSFNELWGIKKPTLFIPLKRGCEDQSLRVKNLEKKGAAILIKDDLSDLEEKVVMIYENPNILNKIKTNLSQYPNLNGANKAANLINIMMKNGI